MMEIWEKKYFEWIEHSSLSPEQKIQLSNLNETEKKESFYKYLDFGTGGMRGKIGLGTNLINEFTVRRVTKALAIYLNQSMNTFAFKKVVISYDNRKYSKEFAEYAAEILASDNIKVYLSDSMRPTPQLSFLVRELSADAGIMITASHNPKEYNGYKIYDSTGGQITLEVANDLKNILEKIDSELDLKDFSLKEFILKKQIILLDSNVDNIYVNKLSNVLQNPKMVEENGHKINVLYTPLHGSGEVLIKKSFNEFGFVNLDIVSEQADGDSNFSTITSPNPEEKSAFKLALHQAKSKDYDFIFATDPDADRMGIVLFDAKKEPIFLNGNQIGILILDYLIRSKKIKDEELSNYFIAKTIVTSDLGERIASKHQITVKNTLTGFKFIGEQIELGERNKKNNFLFGYEESFGYLIDPFVRDKDAIQAAVVFAEFVLECKEKYVTPYERLEMIYKEFGYFKEELKTLTFEGLEGDRKINDILKNLRENRLVEIGNLKVVWYEDYLTSTKINLIDGNKSRIDLPFSNVIKYVLEDGSWICIRPSGTEPKCKIYYSVNAELRKYADIKMINLIKAFNELIE